jgi:hypothetical protein
LFRTFCSEITGYSSIALEGTALVDVYQDLLEQVIGQALATEFYEAAKAVVDLPDPIAREHQIRLSILPSPTLWGIVANLISLWYLGSWAQLSDDWYAAAGLPKPGPADPGRPHVPSAQAYIEQLSYRCAGGHTPGAKPTGFGTWSLPPVSPEMEDVL